MSSAVVRWRGVVRTARGGQGITRRDPSKKGLFRRGSMGRIKARREPGKTQRTSSVFGAVCTAPGDEKAGRKPSKILLLRLTQALRAGTIKGCRGSRHDFAIAD